MSICCKSVPLGHQAQAFFKLIHILYVQKKYITYKLRIAPQFGFKMFKLKDSLEVLTLQWIYAGMHAVRDFPVANSVVAA